MSMQPNINPEDIIYSATPLQSRGFTVALNKHTNKPHLLFFKTVKGFNGAKESEVSVEIEMGADDLRSMIKTLQSFVWEVENPEN